MPFFTGIGDEITDAVGNVITGVADAQAEAARRASGQMTAVGGPGRLRIEPDQVDGAIQVFQSALDKLADRVDSAKRQIRAQAPAADEVSRPAAHAFNRAAFDPDGAIAAWSGAVEQLKSIVEQLKAAKQTMVNTDDTVSQPFASASGTIG